MRLVLITMTAAALAQVPYERIRDARNEPASWLTYGGQYNSHRHSPLEQINTRNVARLRPAWIHQYRAGGEPFQVSPVFVDGVLYITEPPGTVRALDARTGRTLWRYDRKVPNDLRLCCGRVNRGVAVLDDLVYYESIDAHMIALEAKSGRIRWDVEVADYKIGYSSTVAPLALKDKVIGGVGGGEFGIRGFIDAYEAKTGKRLWRFYTIPAPGEPGVETWGGESWKNGAGSTWVTGSYDPDSNTIYWGVGNPGPDWNGDVRPGDNLYTCSVVAIDADTGKKRWHFQFTPHDVHDYDSTQAMVLIDDVYQGRPRKLLANANRNGFYFLLDRENGQFLTGKPYVKVTWASGLDERGRPMRIESASPTEKGTLAYPSLAGGSNWHSPSYSPQTKLFYQAVKEEGAYFYKGEAIYKPGTSFNGGGQRPNFAEEGRGAVRALNSLTGDLVWEFPLHRPAHTGVMSTGGGLVFGSANEGQFFALDARSGKLLWDYYTGAGISANPISYMLDGKQYVAIAAGTALFNFSLD